MKKLTKGLFDDIIKNHHPEKLVYNPTIVEIAGNNIVFKLDNHTGQFCINIDSKIQKAMMKNKSIR